jgi:hypothetical protein
MIITQTARNSYQNGNMKELDKHKKLKGDYKKTRGDHLEKLATKMLNIDERNTKLKEKAINKDIFKLF